MFGGVGRVYSARAPVFPVAWLAWPCQEGVVSPVTGTWLLGLPVHAAVTCVHTLRSLTARATQAAGAERPGPSLLGAVLLSTSQSSSWGSCSRCSPSGASTKRVCSAARGGSWAPAPAQPQVTGARLQPGAEERAAVPSTAASAWQVCGMGRGSPACKVGEGAQ